MFEPVGSAEMSTGTDRSVINVNTIQQVLSLNPFVSESMF